MLTIIGVQTFGSCSSLTSITIPEGVTSIGRSAFNNCTSLSEIFYNAVECQDLGMLEDVFCKAGTGGDGIKVVLGKNVKYIPTYLFSSYWASHSPKIISIEFEEGSVCERIGDYAFAYCKNITSINIPNCVKSIGDGAFVECTGLTSAVIGNSVEIMGVSVFYGCEKLENIIIPNGVKSIGYNAFIYCTNLTSITIPDSIVSIGEDAFYGCKNLKDVYYIGAERQWENIEIDSGNSELIYTTIHYNCK